MLATSICVVLLDILTVHGCLNTSSVNEVPFSSFIKATAWVIYSPLVPCIIVFPVYYFTARALSANTMNHENDRALQLRKKQHYKVVRMFIIVVAAFLLLTMPYSICYMYGNYLLFYDRSNPNLVVVSSVVYILLIPASANCCVNPIIYAKLQIEINRYLKSIIQQIGRVCCGYCDTKRDTCSTQSTIRSPNNQDNSESQL